MQAVVTNDEYDIGLEQQRVRNGLGWVLPNVFPATVVGPSEGNRSTCLSFMLQTQSWVASMALYSAITTDYIVLINASANASLAQSTSATTSADGEQLFGGAFYSGPIRISDSLERSNSSTTTYTRGPSSPGANTVVQASEGFPIVVYQLNQPSNPFISPDFVENNGTDQFVWLPNFIVPLASFVPSPVSAIHEFPIFVQQNVSFSMHCPQ